MCAESVARPGRVGSSPPCWARRQGPALGAREGSGQAGGRSRVLLGRSGGPILLQGWLSCRNSEGPAERGSELLPSWGLARAGAAPAHPSRDLVDGSWAPRELGSSNRLAGRRRKPQRAKLGPCPAPHPAARGHANASPSWPRFDPFAQPEPCASPSRGRKSPPTHAPEQTPALQEGGGRLSPSPGLYRGTGSVLVRP